MDVLLIRDKAGGYGIQALGGMLVEYVHGDFLNVVGFPLNHFCKTLDTIYNSPPASPDHKSQWEDLGETWPLVNSLSKCAENGELEPSDSGNCGASDAASVSGASASASWVQEQNVVGPESALASTCGCNREEFPHKIVDLMDGFKASKVALEELARVKRVVHPKMKILSLAARKALVSCSVECKRS